MGTADKPRVGPLQIAFATEIDFGCRCAAKESAAPQRRSRPLRSKGGKYPNLPENSLHLMLIAGKSLLRGGGGGCGGGGGGG